jgi:hypothetical protein
MIIAEAVLTLSWTMLFEIVCNNTYDPLKNYWNLWLELGRCLHWQSWTILFGIVRKITHGPLKDNQNIWLCLKRCLHCHARCYLKSFAKVRVTRSTTIEIFDYSWDSAYLVMNDAIWNRLQTYAWSKPGPSKSMIMAEPVLTFTCKVRMAHPGTIKICGCSWDGAYIVMDEAIWNRLQTYVLPTPGPSKSMVIDETVHTLTWTMLFELVCKCTHDPLQDLSPSKSMIIAETVLTLSWTMLSEIVAKVCMAHHGALQYHQNPWL